MFLNENLQESLEKPKLPGLTHDPEAFKAPKKQEHDHKETTLKPIALLPKP